MNARPIHRFASFMIDSVVTGGIFVLLGYPLWIALIEAMTKKTSDAIFNLFNTSLIIIPTLIIIIITYYLVLPLFWKHQTIGRYLTRISIVKDDGTPIDFQTLFVREIIGRMLSAFMSLGLTLVADAVIIGQKRRQSFADVLARTRVIDK